MASLEERERYSRIDPELEALLEKTGPPPTLGGPDTDIAAARKLLTDRKKAQLASQAGAGAFADVAKEDISIPVRDGTTIQARVYRPTSAQKPAGGSPVVTMMHGGGFCLGGVENEELLCSLFAQKHGAVVINVCYRLAPEFVFPTAVEDAWDATRWIAANAERLDATPAAGFIVGGISAGGNLTDVVGHLARDHGLSPPLTGLLELIPIVCPKEVCPEKYLEYYTSDENKDVPVLPQKSIDWLMGLYRPDVHSELFSPFNWPRGHKGLPPVVFQVCGMDILRDEALIYEKVLREEAGIRTKLWVYPGLPHGFWSVWPDMKTSRRLVKDSVEGLGWLLEQGRM